MGYLTTITIYNDALGCFEKYPEKFAKAVFNGIYEASRYQKPATVPFEGYANYIQVEPSRHADDEIVYLHSGNGVTALGAYTKDFDEFCVRNPKLALDFIKRAERQLKMCRARLKKLSESTK